MALAVQRRAPMVLEPHLGLIVVGERFLVDCREICHEARCQSHSAQAVLISPVLFSFKAESADLGKQRSFLELCLIYPLVAVKHSILLLHAGSAAWKTSWTTGKGGGSKQDEDAEGDERNVKVLKLETLMVLRELQVTENSVALLRLQVC